MPTDKNLEAMILNRVQSQAVFDYMVENDLVDDDQLYLVEESEGGGAFLVTVTRSGSDFVSDKTYAEIVAAHEAGNVVIAKCQNMVMALTDVNPNSVGFAAGMDYGNMCLSISSENAVFADDFTFLTSSSMSNHNVSASAHESLFDAKLDKLGGTLEGPLTLNGDPMLDLDAATKQYVDNSVSGITAADVGARPSDWTPTPADIGAVANTGGTITGDLTLQKNGASSITLQNTASGVEAQVIAGGNEAYFEARTDENNARRITISEASETLDDSVRIQHTVDGATTNYNLFGEHNKPTGSYTGNGEARTIEIGGMGNAVKVGGGGKGTGIVTDNGCIRQYTTQVTALANTDIKFGNGKLVIGTESIWNESGQTYYYQVL